MGIVKDTNEDSYLVKLAEGVDGNRAALAVVCDGVGGLAKGELASASVVRAFSKWFDFFLAHFSAGIEPDKVKQQWSEILELYNRKITEHGEKTGAKLATTFSCLLLYGEGMYIIGHIGDSRIYSITSQIEALTYDHTVTATAVRLGRMTEAEALTAPGSNVLTKCIGSEMKPDVDFITGRAAPWQAFLLCSDGFRNRNTADELYAWLRPASASDAGAMKSAIDTLIQQCKNRGEKDNITAILVSLMYNGNNSDITDRLDATERLDGNFPVGVSSPDLNAAKEVRYSTEGMRIVFEDISVHTEEEIG